MVAFVAVEKRVRAPLLDLALLGNRFLVGSSVAIIVEAGCINALMYVCGLSFQNPDGLGMTPPSKRGATLPAAAGIVVTAPLITRFVDRLGAARRVIAAGFGIATVAFAVFAFVEASWGYAAFVVPMVVLPLLVGRIHPAGPPTTAHYAAAAAAASHTVPTRPVTTRTDGADGTH
ncbi:MULTISPECIES: MFS transporter [Streptomyces]|uniref:MFS transporter n=1 Tax=Streptomyces venezuelae TaxID=54571 RepID=A0A5P2AL63_STRVZ|nr:MFS transporter [Streptomyces venezuelae]QES18952.1 hypothetical protein DEJ46_07515 [Streptomyces venezuelae]